MSRSRRILIPDYPYHIVQRGLNRMEVFSNPSDFQLYLALLEEVRKKIPIVIYAFCIMSNHIHLILRPKHASSNLSIFMQRVTHQYALRYNNMYNRCGAVWSGRFKSSLIQTDEYLLACSRYVEMNPIRAGIAKVPEDYRWSSYRHKIGKETIPWLSPDPCYLKLGQTEAERQRAYEKWISGNIPKEEITFIKTAIKRQWITGNYDFKKELSKQTRSQTGDSQK